MSPQAQQTRKEELPREVDPSETYPIMEWQWRTFDLDRRQSTT